MFSMMIDFANLMLAALVVGAMFGVWLILNPADRSAGAYIAIHQQAVRGVNTVLPALGAATILVTIAAAVLARDDRARFTLLIATALCFMAAGLITRFLNQPINAIIMTWSSDAPPANWTRLRDAWWRWHHLRMIAGFGGISLLIGAILRRSWNL